MINKTHEIDVYVAIGPQNKGMIWVIFKWLILFFLLNLGIEVLSYFFLEIANCGGPKHDFSREPKQYISSINKGQQAYWAENAKFSNSIDKLGMDIKIQTRNFKYSTRATENAVFSYGMPRPDAEDAYKTVSFGLFWWPKRREFKGYVGSVFLVPANNTNYESTHNDMTTKSILCFSTASNPTEIAEPILQNGHLTCGNGTQPVTK